MPARFQVQGSKFKVFKRSKFYEPFKTFKLFKMFTTFQPKPAAESFSRTVT